MKKIITILMLSSFSVFAAMAFDISTAKPLMSERQELDRLRKMKLMGIWVDKTSPERYKYDFSDKNDFSYTYRLSQKTKYKKATFYTKKGVWETGNWVISTEKRTETKCTLVTYADNGECCFSYKFISNNLVLTNRYNKNGAGGMCESRVLIPLSDEDTLNKCIKESNGDKDELKLCGITNWQ